MKHRIRGHAGCPETMPEDLRQRIQNLIFNERDAQWLIDQYEKMQLSCEAMKRWVENVDVYILKATKRVAWQLFQVKAGDLESSDDPDGNPVVRSVLSTDGLLQSSHQFNWMQSGGVRSYKVVIGPGDGVPSHHVIINRDDANIWIRKWEASAGSIQDARANCCRPYGMTGRQLQKGYWEADADDLVFWPTKIAIGTFVYLEQELPMTAIG